MLRVSSPIEMKDTRTQMRTERELLQALEQRIGRAIAVTGNVRAARALRRHYEHWQHARGNSGWMTPEILGWEPWLGTLWDAAVLAGAESRVLLTEVQELELWNKVLAQDDASGQTLSLGGMAELAQGAWHQMHQYRIPPGRLRGNSSLDGQAFRRWTTEFEKICGKSSFVSPSLLEAALVKWIEAPKALLPEEVFLVGFDRATPAQALLIDALKTRGCSVEFVELQGENAADARPAIVYTHTLEEEIASAAYWIRDKLARNPMQSIGVVVPSLDEMRGAIDRIFRRVLAPSSMDIRARSAALPYEFSLGTPMLRLQSVRTALTLLRWLHGAVPPEEVSWLIVHGGFGDRARNAQYARARLDRRFRERDFQLGGLLSLSAFRQWLTRSGSWQEAGPVRQTMERFAAAGKTLGLEKSRTFAEWREAIDELLKVAQWNLLATETSVEYQLLRRWNTLLNDLYSVTSVSGPVKFSVVLEKLEHLAAHMLFTLETRNAPVQILGASESAGLVFDSVWWLNARADVWPSRGKAQPFLPWAVQREAHMPYADPEEDFAFALRTTKRILSSGTNIVASFALETSGQKNASTHIPDREILLSPLIREALPETPIMPVKELLSESGRSDFPLESHLETIQEEAAVPFAGTKVSGGVRFLELHAACPFRAFAELRLETRPLPESAMGLPANAQGSIVHRVLERFWQQMHSMQNLLESTSEQHREILRKHIQDALAQYMERTEEGWQNALLAIEAERIEDRLMEWLEVEKQRAAFTVLKTEHNLENVLLGGLELRCRIDRIDEVNDQIVLIDYKTGAVDRNACEGDRPDQPQLMAYAVLREHPSSAEKELAGIAFAGLHPKKVEFTPILSLPGIFPSTAGKRVNERCTALPEEIQEQQKSWKATLTRLAEEFQAGVVLVDPKKPGETCRHCGQSLLCRIREASGEMENGAEQESEESLSSNKGREL